MAHNRTQLASHTALALALTLGLACTSGGLDQAAAQAQGRTTIMSTKTYQKPSDVELKQKLTPEQYEVTQHDSTERAFRNAYWDNHEPGLYVDVTTGEPLFASVDKFDSGTGWPSFTQPVEPQRVVTHSDTSYGMVRTEVRSKAGNAHLGHVFDDGPAPTRLRYCINSASLRFVPLAKLKDEGYAEYLSLFEKHEPAAAK